MPQRPTGEEGAPRSSHSHKVPGRCPQPRVGLTPPHTAASQTLHLGSPTWRLTTLTGLRFSTAGRRRPAAGPPRPPLAGKCPFVLLTGPLCGASVQVGAVLRSPRRAWHCPWVLGGTHVSPHPHTSACPVPRVGDPTDVPPWAGDGVQPAPSPASPATAAGMTAGSPR